MVKSRFNSCVALLVSVALILPTTIVSAAPGQTAAPGRPYADCQTELANAAQLEKGLQKMGEKIDQIQQRIDEARNAEGHLSREAQKQAEQAQLDLTAGTAVTVLKDNILGVKRWLEKLAQSALPGKAKPVLKALNDFKKIEKLFQNMDRLVAAGNWKLAMHEGHTFTEQMSAFVEYLNESGITGELASSVGETATARLAGTAAGGAALSSLVVSLAVAAGIYAINTVAADEAAFQNALDQRAAADTVNQLRRNRSTYQDRITSVRLICSQQPRRAEQPKPKPDALATEPPSPTPPTPVTPPEAGGGLGVGTAVLLGGLGAAGIVGYQVPTSSRIKAA